MIKIFIEINYNDIENYQYQFSDNKLKSLGLNGETILLIGDYIYPDLHNKNCFKDINISPQWIIENISGHFYYVIKYKSKILVGNSFGSILPVYYSSNSKKIIISSKIEMIKSSLKVVSINKRFFLENILFNYNLFNNTHYNEISLVPSFSYVQINEEGSMIKSLKTIDRFIQKRPKKWKKAINDISDLLIETTEKYLPKEKYLSALTSGFDGRTLVAIGKHYKKDIVTFCYGNDESVDFKMANEISKSINNDFFGVNLDEEYISNHSYNNGVEFILKSNGNASFSRAHYIYSLQKIKNKYSYFISGNFGSEIFRAAHLPGVLISQNLYNIFNSDSSQEALEKIESSNVFREINFDGFVEEWNELANDIALMPKFSEDYRKFTTNQIFYKFVFEEVFRKYFGPEIINQFNYITYRTPFLDYSFVKEVLGTELSGVYTDFFTNNPIKRFRGQFVYSNVIYKLNPVLSKMQTGKGYAPIDLLSFIGKLKIVKGFIKKKVLKENVPKDENSVNASFNVTIQHWKKMKIDENLFNHQYVSNNFNSNNNKDSFYILLSQIFFYNLVMDNSINKLT